MLQNQELERNYEMTRGEYLVLRSKLMQLSNLISRMHDSYSNTAIIEEYNNLRNKLQYAQIIESKNARRGR